MERLGWLPRNRAAGARHSKSWAAKGLRGTGRVWDAYPVMNQPLRVLIVEDSESDAALIESELRRAGYRPECHQVQTAEAMRCRARTAAVGPDDRRLPHAAFRRSGGAGTREGSSGLDLPFIIVSGHITDETAVAAMRAGAHDYVMKDNLARLGPAVERELREAEVRRERRRAEEDLRRAHEELETRVQQRTAELKTVNAKLQTAIAERKRLEYELLEITERERRRLGSGLAR